MRACVRACVRRVEARGYRAPPWHATGTEVPRAPKKKCTPAAERRARTKRREKNISAGAKARERRKKNIWAGAKKILASTRTQPTKGLIVRTVESRSDKKDSGGSGGIPPG